MHHLSIDIETYSSVDIAEAGVHRYVQSPDFCILLFAYKLDQEPTRVVDLACGEEIPADIVAALGDKDYTMHAYNASFEWCCLNRVGFHTPINQWKCTMVHGMYCGYPAGLAAIGHAIGLPQEKQKLAAGKALIQYFCKPCRPTKANGGRTRNLPQHDPDKWALFKIYNGQDVEAEYAILQRLNLFPMPEKEEKIWQMDILMNNYGVKVDKALIDGALRVNDMSTAELLDEARRLTGLQNPNSPSQLLAWLAEKGLELPNLQKQTVEDALKAEEVNPDARRALEIRQQLGKTSIKKYEKMEAAMTEGDRVHGLTQYYGANRTGRWAGRLVQIQNLPRNYIETLDEARALVEDGNYLGLKVLYGNVPDTLTQLIRTAFIPSDGRKFVVADFSAIEARVIAWLAGEEWVNEVFRTTGKIYEATAAQMFNVPVETIKKGCENYSLRQKGKVATLALGYQGGSNALIAMGALRMGIPEEELPDIVQKWRDANPNIRRFWYAVEEAAVGCVNDFRDRFVPIAGGAVPPIRFRMEMDLMYGQSFLTVQLPSGRKLFYPKPYLEVNRFDKMAVHYYAVAQTTGKWGPESTYGGKMTENIVQAVARDCLAEVLLRIQAKGWPFVFHVHDEVIVDGPQDLTVDTLCDLMAEPIPWAPGLVLKGAGFEGAYYKKD